MSYLFYQGGFLNLTIWARLKHKTSNIKNRVANSAWRKWAKKAQVQRQTFSKGSLPWSSCRFQSKIQCVNDHVPTRAGVAKAHRMPMNNQRVLIPQLGWEATFMYTSGGCVPRRGWRRRQPKIKPPHHPSQTYIDEVILM